MKKAILILLVSVFLLYMGYLTCMSFGYRETGQQETETEVKTEQSPQAQDECINPSREKETVNWDDMLTVWLDGERQEICFRKGREIYIPVTAFHTKGEYGISSEEIVLELCGGTAVLYTKEDTAVIGNFEVPAACIYDGCWYVPGSVLEYAGYAVLEDPEFDQVFYTRIVHSREMSRSVRFPILNYHNIDNNGDGIESLYVSPEDFERQMKYLKEEGYTFVTFDDFDRLDEIEKPVMITFDDGYRDNYVNAFPVLQKYNVKATVFIVAKSIDHKPRSMTSEMLWEMSQSGLVSVQSHTYTHGDLMSMSDSDMEKEMKLSRLVIARATGKIPYALAYPRGETSEALVEHVNKTYEFAVLANNRMFDPSGNDVWHINRFGIYKTTTFEQFIDLLG